MTTVRPENNAIKGRTKHFLTYHLFQISLSNEKECVCVSVWKLWICYKFTISSTKVYIFLQLCQL